jgi:hypothetical protein
MHVLGVLKNQTLSALMFLKVSLNILKIYHHVNITYQVRIICQFSHKNILLDCYFPLKKSQNKVTHLKEGS